MYGYNPRSNGNYTSCRSNHKTQNRAGRIKGEKWIKFKYPLKSIIKKCQKKTSTPLPKQLSSLAQHRIAMCWDAKTTFSWIINDDWLFSLPVTKKPSASRALWNYPIFTASFGPMLVRQSLPPSCHCRCHHRFNASKSIRQRLHRNVAVHCRRIHGTFNPHWQMTPSIMAAAVSSQALLRP